MKKHKFWLVVSVVVIIVISIVACMVCGQVKKHKVEAIFEGFLQNGQQVVDENVVFAEGSQVYAFRFKNGDLKMYKIENKTDGIFKISTDVAAEEGAFSIQNQLAVGKTYCLEVKDGDVIVGAELVNEIQSVENGVVTYTPGEKTLKNFLKTSMAPIGTLIVYGGGWDLQDVGAANETRTIGVSSAWRSEFENQTADYDWLETYPYDGWCKDHFRGLDTGGYIGWVLYNTFYDTSLEYPGLVYQPDELKKVLTKKYAFGVDVLGNLKSKDAVQVAQSLKPGDIIASSMHYRVVIGVCDDNSVVFADCTVATSKTGANGGGVQLVAVNPNDNGNTDCEAYRLVKKYMNQLYPEWLERYEPRLLDTEVCFDLVCAIRMDVIGDMFSDPDNYSAMSAAEILADICNE